MRVIIHEIEQTKDYMRKKIYLVHDKPMDMFKETHSQFTKEQKLIAKNQYKQRLKKGCYN